MNYEDDIFESKLQDIRDKLIDLVKEDGEQVTISSSGDVNFRCVNPDHPDNNPSMFVSQKVPFIAHCRSCKTTCNIFQMNNILHGKPLHGVGFIRDNVNDLAIRFELEPVDMSDLSEEQLFRLKVQQIHDAASLVLSRTNDPSHSTIVTDKYAKQLKIKPEVLQEMRIATVLDIDSFMQKVQLIGQWSSMDLDIAGLKPWLFGPEKITFTIFNSHGAPVAFAARNLDHDGRFGVTINPTQTRKWINSPLSVIYNKTDALYGLAQAKKCGLKNVYVFEGYTDVCVARSYGIVNSVCVGGTAFSPEHVKMLANAGFTVATIAMDNDEAGRLATDSVLKKAFNEITEIRPQILIVPNTPKQDGSGEFDHDPDSYIHLYGADAFRSLKPKTAFRYTIDRMPDSLESSDEKAEFLARFLPFISSETNAVTREQMQYDISKRIGISIVTVKESLERREQQFNLENRNAIKKEFMRFRNKFLDSIDLAPDNVVDLSNDFMNFVNSKMNSETAKALSTGEVQEGVESWWARIQAATLEDAFWKTGYTYFDNTIGGIKKTGNFTGITAPSNIGKSCLMMNLALGILENNDPNELLLLYWTIDDPREDTLTKMASISCKFPISKVSDYLNLNSNDQTKIDKFLQKLNKWIEKDRCFSIKDMSIGNNAYGLMKWVQKEREKQPHKKVLLLIDNFANMSYTGDELSGQISNINHLHELRVKNDIAIVSSFEVNKTGNKEEAGANSLYGSGKIQYRLTLNLSLWNEVDVHRSQKITKKPSFFWYDDRQDIRPIMKLSLIKRKMTFKDESFNGDIFFRFVNKVGVIDEIGGKTGLDKFIAENATMLHTGIDMDFVPPQTSRYLKKGALTTPLLSQNSPPQALPAPLPDISSEL
jgi:DNA primase catalytic core